MTATENDLLELGRQMRSELAEAVREVRVELPVLIIEELNRATAGARMESEVRAAVATAINELPPFPSLDDLEARTEAAASAAVATLPIPEPVVTHIESPCLCSDAHGETLKVRLFVNQLADRLGLPRMEL